VISVVYALQPSSTRIMAGSRIFLPPRRGEAAASTNPKSAVVAPKAVVRIMPIIALYAAIFVRGVVNLDVSIRAPTSTRTCGESFRS
jgi:hypothetical protein